MPIARNYNGGSIVYFAGDKGDEVYVLQAGRVILISTALDTGEEIREDVQIGEFFGVKSSLGKFPREETAQVIGKTTCIVFKLHEFEQLVMKNTHLILKMLRVFSKQLRNIHRQIRDILKAGAAKDPSFELMSVAESFYRSGNVDHAVYALEKYLEVYADGDYTDRAHDLLSQARKGLTYPHGYPPLQIADQKHKVDASFVTRSMASADSLGDDPFALEEGAPAARPAEKEPGAADILMDGLTLMSQNKADAALAKFNECLAIKKLHTADDQEAAERAQYEKGRAELKLGKVDDASNSFSIYLKKFPTGEFMKHAIFQLGVAAEAKGNKERARTLYHKVATMPPPDDATRDARKRLEKLG
ncbi:MAG TPA: cyclic nucleotide-binding domain-containing protein [Leptospiraceae bacterium]|nr:cyclic nucleotide-binding domain-containing protein [Leptospirales bacterium]HMU82667.1 cyclic nucleotide-binding domain-containing protein [Leptospiraceae bacterium]HMX55573.1 cyclic nucleotide-binding domain-containing protein [Leptospiraceae bacterium]HMZ37732.1 cyclic nucleotide-binding domain-containing protein [Leptospiraceae bacterium]HNE22140.1 cyclic nucleotide-binding domain-containing protein [Leptospiraceae bacterium]